MAKAAKTKFVELPQADAASLIPPAGFIPFPKKPAVFINNANAQWGEGIVRLDLGDQTGEQPVEPRASVVMTAQQARLLAGILNQAADALLPASPAEDGAEG